MNMLKIRFYILFVFFISINWAINAQVAGDRIYRFLSLPYTAQASALGGKIISFHTPDISLISENPAYETESSKKLGLNYSHIAGKINFGSVNYRLSPNWAIGLLYFDYGSFIRADERAFKYNDFKAADFSFLINYHKKISPKINVGANIKPVISFLAEYNSMGLASDWGVYYSDSINHLYGGFVIKNLGFQIISYQDKNFEKLPLELSLGGTKILEHAPFAVSLSLQDLQRPVLVNYTTTQNNSFIPTTNSKPTLLFQIGDNFMRHLIVGLEILPKNNFTINLGYNHQRRKEMSLENAAKLSGFSAGFRLRLKKYTLNYAYNSFFMLRGTNFLSFKFSPFNYGLNKME